MKFKKVEISAFRIYDDPHNATFDLTAKSGNPAGFVSLYAPNGFGKTSFYDAVEYGMTGSVDRFYLRAEELEKMANLQSIDKFIRHSSSERDTYVKIYTDSDQNPVINRPFYKHGKQRHDLNLDPKKRKVDNFQEVILSQEWISAFLTEHNGEYRYKKFMDIPELAPINNYYTNLKHLLTSYWNKKNNLLENKTEFEKNIQSVSDGNLLETINDQIELLIEKFGDQSFSKISLSTTQEEIKTIKDRIAGKIDSNNREILLIELSGYITVAKSGNESNIGIDTFFQLIENNSKAAAKLLGLQQLLDKFQALERLNVEIEKNKRLQQTYIEDKNLITNAQADFNEYERVDSLLKDKNTTAGKLGESVIRISEQLESLNRVEIEKRGQIETLLRKIEELNLQKTSFPLKKLDYLKIESQIAIQRKYVSSVILDIENNDKVYRDILPLIANLQKVIQEIPQNIFPPVLENDSNVLPPLIQRSKENQQNLFTAKEQLSALESTIEQNQTLNNTIDEFIKAGLSIVHQRQSKECPLCEQEYESYTDLVKKITDNNALNESLKILLAKRSTIEDTILKLSNDLKENTSQLLSFYQRQLDKLIVRRSALSTLIDDLKVRLNDIDADLEQLEQKRVNYSIELDGLSFDDFEKKLEESLKECHKLKDETIPLANENKRLINNANEQLKSTNEQIDLIKKEIEELRLNAKYQFVLDWFKNNYSEQEIKKELLVQKEISLTEQISTINAQRGGLEEKIAVINTELTSFKKENLISDKNDLLKNTQDNDAKIHTYRYFLKDKLDIVVSQMEKATLSTILEDKRIIYDEELRQVRISKEEYKKLERYCENVWPFLQSENAKLELANAIKELEFLEQKVEPILHSERNRTKVYLESRIKNFFHEELINSLYKKIDPHPDFKFVEFKANFEDDIPRLDVFVKNTKDESSLIPNLYFSTAQINILSLSIFLATALNSKEYQCIFVDDPIQSMDSINVLSTIDLLRSLVVNEGKQIILSTHDQNFYNLLQMKMPDNLFESRFIELESFGKVKIG
jgi:exonuclease SbcC